MPSYAEIRRSVEAAWLLARGDQRGMALFDLSVDGFWHSFAAALLVAPAYALVLADQYAHLGWPESPWWTILAEAISYLSGWVAFPIAAPQRSIDWRSSSWERWWWSGVCVRRSPHRWRPSLCHSGSTRSPARVVTEGSARR
mgnify:CR=1 FL=1